MSHALVAALSLGALTLTACGNSQFAVRPIPRIAADSVGQPIEHLQETFGDPRKIDKTPTQLLYVWFIAQSPAGAPTGFHGCEMEVTVDARSQRILGYSLSNIGWAKCGDVERKVRLAQS